MSWDEQYEEKSPVVSDSLLKGRLSSDLFIILPYAPIGSLLMVKIDRADSGAIKVLSYHVQGRKVASYKSSSQRSCEIATEAGGMNFCDYGEVLAALSPSHTPSIAQMRSKLGLKSPPTAISHADPRDKNPLRAR